MAEDKTKNRNMFNCPHIYNQHDTLLDVQRVQINSCSSCDYSGANLWVCLHYNCLAVGCSEQANDHSTQHFQLNNTHCVHLNVTSQRAWCYLCDCEVFPQLQRFIGMQNLFVQPFAMLSSSKTNSLTCAPAGLVGLQNLANTCYLNAALQALSNVQPLTHYFISCADIVHHTTQYSKLDLAKSYYQLIRDMWCPNNKKIDYLVPRRLLYSMRVVHPMFRGFQQHDTQEFLRCFMDQLHEELKEQTLMNAIDCSPSNDSDDKTHLAIDEQQDDLSTLSTASSSSSLTDTNYETCDDSSSLSEEHSMYPDRAHMQRTYNTQLHAENGKQVLKIVRSIISDVFDGKLLSSVQCLTCDRLSTREETFQDLSLPIPSKHFMQMLHRTRSMSMQSLNSIDSSISTHSQTGWFSWMWNILRSWLWGPSVSIYDCMASFFSADELKGDNMYSCEKCNKLRTGIKYARILNLPEVLCIHLKRFHHDLSYSCKISKHVQFPLEGFDMRPYLDKNCTSHVTTYDLISIICHHGSVGSGHYTCYARNALNERWYEYDDHRVSQVSADTVRNSQAYVLFYSKSNPQMELVRNKAMELCAAHPPDTADMRFYITREWISRFYTFAEPGPINNWTILCPHGGILPSKMPLYDQIAVSISQPVWDFLYGKFGGGPVLNILFECNTCMRAAEALVRRQLYEMSMFSKYNAMEFTLETDAIYAISLPWLRKWQQFAKGLTSVEPGPITNASIINPASKNNSTRSTSPTRVRLGADYAQINSFLWRFLHDIYGGGPDIILRGGFTVEKLSNSSQSDKERPLWPDGESASLSDTESICQDTEAAGDTKSHEEETLLCVKSSATNFELNETYDECSLNTKKNTKNAKSHRHSVKSMQKSKVLVPRAILRKRAKRCMLSKRKKILGKGHVLLGKGNEIMEKLEL